MVIEKRIGAYSAYAIAVENGFQGTVEEWLESLIGPRGYQGWGVSAVSVSADGSLIFTVQNPETGETRELEPIQIETLNALNSISTAKDEAVNEVKKAQTQATEAVDTAKTQAIQGINAAGQTAVENAQTAITTAKNQAVSDVQAAGQSAVGAVEEAQTAGVQAVEDAQTEAVEAVETAQTNAVQSVQNAGTAEIEKINDILPVPTAEDAGKVPIAKPDGSGYELGKAGVQIDDTKTALDTTWSSQNIVSRICPHFTTEGAIVTCNPVESSRLNAVVQIEPVQEGTGDPSPDNVRPIRGWDVVNVWRGGKNLFDISRVTDTSEIKNNGDTLSVNTTLNSIRCPMMEKVKDLCGNIPINTYTFNANTTSTQKQMYLSSGILWKFGTSQLVNDSIKESVPYFYGNSVNEAGTISEIQLELGSAATEYEPYRGEIFEIPFGQTVYGGTLDVTTGVLTKTHENIPSYAGEDVGDDWMSSTGSLTDGAQVVYRLKNPVSAQLTPQEIRALSGVNTVYADTGNVTVSGYSDPNAIINSLAGRVAALEQNAIGG